MARAVAEATSALAEAVEVPVSGLGDAELGDLAVEVTRLASTLAAVEAHVLAQAETREVGAAVGATSTANWLAHQTRMTRVEAHRRMRPARDLQDRPATAGALAQGDVLPEQARVICDALAQLDTIPTDLIAARDLDLPALKTRLTMTEDGHGCVHGRFTLPTLQAAMLKTALLALAAPKHQAAVNGTTRSQAAPSAERLGQAFAQYVERSPADRIPDAGGVPATVVVTIDLAHLQQGLGSGVLDDGGRISATQARRLACEAGIIPAVLGGQGQPLDVGRRKRFHTTRLGTGKLCFTRRE